jgi:hypothetical protein
MYYKGHGEVKVDILLLLIANNCWTSAFALGYWPFYFSSDFDSDEERKPLQVKDCLKWVWMLPYLPCPYWGQSFFVTVGNYIVSNQLIAGSIMVRHMILILVLYLPLRVDYLMRCTHNALWGVIMNSFDSTISYLAVSPVFGKICKICSTGWYVHTFSVLHGVCCLLEIWVARVLKITDQLIALSCRDAGMIKFPLYIALLYSQ